MKPRRQTLARRSYQWSGQVMMAGLSMDRWIAYWGGAEEAERAWEALRWDMSPGGRHATNPGTRYDPWWVYEHGIDPDRCEACGAAGRLSRAPWWGGPCCPDMQYWDDFHELWRRGLLTAEERRQLIAWDYLNEDGSLTAKQVRLFEGCGICL